MELNAITLALNGKNDKKYYRYFSKKKILKIDNIKGG